LRGPLLSRTSRRVRLSLSGTRSDGATERAPLRGGPWGGAGGRRPRPPAEQAGSVEGAGALRPWLPGLRTGTVGHHPRAGSEARQHWPGPVGLSGTRAEGRPAWPAGAFYSGATSNLRLFVFAPPPPRNRLDPPAVSLSPWR
jgi:hypothetical protein